MKKIILLTVLSLTFIFTTLVSAGSRKNIKQSQKQINNTIVTFNNLSLAIDYWHDATLKANKKAIAEHLKTIHAIISDNIRDNYQSVSYAKLEASYTQNKSKNSIKNNTDDLQNEESVLKTKKLIFSSLKKSKSFGYSYRLLADYQQLLKNEINANKIEIAEDASEQKEGAGQIRVIR